MDVGTKGDKGWIHPCRKGGKSGGSHADLEVQGGSPRCEQEADSDDGEVAERFVVD